MPTGRDASSARSRKIAWTSEGPDTGVDALNGRRVGVKRPTRQALCMSNVGERDKQRPSQKEVAQQHLHGVDWEPVQCKSQGQT